MAVMTDRVPEQVSKHRSLFGSDSKTPAGSAQPRNPVGCKCFCGCSQSVAGKFWRLLFVPRC